MTYGLKVLNADGNYQIDDRYFTFAFREKFTVDSSGYTGTSWQYWAFHYEGDFPIIAVRCNTNEPVFVIDANRDDDGPDNFAIFAVDAATTKTLTVYVFDIIEEFPTIPDYGLVVYNSDGRVVFHSDCRPIVCEEALVMTPANNGQTFALDTTATYACLFSDIKGGYGMHVDLPAGGSTGTLIYDAATLGDNAVDSLTYVVDVTAL